MQLREEGHEEEAIGMHWDKDEELVDAQGLNVHPHLSSVSVAGLKTEWAEGIARC